MTNKNTNYIREERLVEIVQGTYCGFDEGVAIAAELLAARAELRRMSEWHDQIADTVPCDWHQMVLAERDAARADLHAVATIAHEGGLARLSEGEALCAIRRLTLCLWVRTGSLADGQERVRAAMLLAKHKGPGDGN